MNGMIEPAVLERLKDIVGSDFVTDDPEVCIAYSRDLATYLKFGKYRSPDCVVLPTITSEVQNIVAVARQFKTPLIPLGSGINVASAHIPRKGGIIMDLRRMNNILEIDEEAITATLQPHVTIARMSTELQRKGFFIPVPGAPSTVTVGSNFTHGNTNKASARFGFQYAHIVSVEMVLPDGSLLRTGSWADAFSGDRSWPRGPGPDLTLLARYALGLHGIVTGITIKAHPLDDICLPIWAAFEHVEDAHPAFVEMAHREICTGSSLYGGFKYNSYSADTAECGWRQSRIHPEFVLALTIQGSKRRVAFEEKVVRDLTEKNNGRIVTDRLPFYQMFVDTHMAMAASLYSEFAFKYWASPGAGPSFLGPSSMDKIIPCFNAMTNLASEDEAFGDVDWGNWEFNRSMIAYPDQGGHFAIIEGGIAAHPTDPKAIKAYKRYAPKLVKALAAIGVTPDQSRANTRPGEFGISPEYLELAEKFRHVLDKEGIMNPGVISPLIYR